MASEADEVDVDVVEDDGASRGIDEAAASGRGPMVALCALIPVVSVPTSVRTAACEMGAPLAPVVPMAASC